MTAKELKRIFQNGECLSLDTMRLYNDGKLNKKTVHEVEKHLLECSLCSAAVDGLTTRRMGEINKLSSHIQRRLAVYMNTPPRVSFFRRFGMAIVTGAVLVTGGVTWWYFAQNERSNSPQLSDTVQVPADGHSFIQPPGSSTVQPAERPHDNGAVVVPGEPGGKLADNSGHSSTRLQSPPADQPGSTDVVSEKQEEPANPQDTRTQEPGNTETTQGPDTRNAVNKMPLRVKSVQVYPPVTHSDKTTRKESKDGQLGRKSGSDAAFKLDEMPSFPGGDAALRSYIMSNFNPTAADREKLKRYSTGVLFVVNSKTGAISAPELSFSISPEVDAELLRVINSMPSWNPGKKRGEVDVMIGITFE